AILQVDLSDPRAWISPVLQLLATGLQVFWTPLMFFATHPLHLVAMGIFGLGLLTALVGLGPSLWSAGHHLWQQPQGRQGLRIVGSFLGGMALLIAALCYGYGADITRGIRYSFIYYPALIVAMAGMVAPFWHPPADSPSAPPPDPQMGSVQVFLRWWLPGRRWAQAIALLTGICGLLVSLNLAIPKVYGPERFVPFVQEHSSHPIVLGTVEPLHQPGQVVGIEYLSILWELHRHFHPSQVDSGWSTPPQFVAIGWNPDDPNSVSIDQRLALALTPQPRPFDLWMLRHNPDLTAQGCTPADDMAQGNKASYFYHHLVCR
ncbi:MAG: hypothetical protein O3C67_12020, partial [Cyanobacteria bacterium]|nr:hypothetical protein [Cyanobacteriota bacterium]